MKPREKGSAYLRAKSRVDKVRGFYTHLFVYIAVNIGVSTFKIIRNMNYGESFEQALFDFGTIALWLLWGIGLFLHAFNVYGLPKLLGRNWEEDKIQEFMDQEDQNKFNNY